jgi:hypothetical protein
MPAFVNLCDLRQQATWYKKNIRLQVNCCIYMIFKKPVLCRMAHNTDIRIQHKHRNIFNSFLFTFFPSISFCTAVSYKYFLYIYLSRFLPAYMFYRNTIQTSLLIMNGRRDILLHIKEDWYSSHSQTFNFVRHEG